DFTRALRCSRTAVDSPYHARSAIGELSVPGLAHHLRSAGAAQIGGEGLVHASHQTGALGEVLGGDDLTGGVGAVDQVAAVVGNHEVHLDGGARQRIGDRLT